MPPSLIAYAVLYRRLAVRHFPSHHDPFCGKVIRAPDHALQYAPADSISAIYFRNQKRLAEQQLFIYVVIYSLYQFILKSSGIDNLKP